MKLLVKGGAGYIGKNLDKLLIEELIKKYDIDPKESLISGDHISEIQVGYNSKMPFRYLISKKNINHFSIIKVFISLFDCDKFLENKAEI